MYRKFWHFVCIPIYMYLGQHWRFSSTRTLHSLLCNSAPDWSISPSLVYIHLWCSHGFAGGLCAVSPHLLRQSHQCKMTLWIFIVPQMKKYLLVALASPHLLRQFHQCKMTLWISTLPQMKNYLLAALVANRRFMEWDAWSMMAATRYCISAVWVRGRLFAMVRTSRSPYTTKCVLWKGT